MQFLIIARDGTDDGALQRRLNARTAHIEIFKAGLQNGQNIAGGALLNDGGDMCGSAIIVDFPDRESLDAWISADPYVTGDVWKDIEIIPFKLAGVKS